MYDIFQFSKKGLQYARLFWRKIDFMFIDELRKKKDQLIAISRKYKARNIQVFGSVARGEETKHSDVDILISLPKAYDMFKQRIPLQEELKKQSVEG